MPHRKQSWSKQNRRERFKKKFLSRMQATRLLQVDSMNFRRMTILKGIYPRAIGKSKQKASGDDKQYYLAKEIKWLVHDQLNNRIQAFNAWEKKVKRAEAMNRTADLKALHGGTAKPKYSLVATLKERYPYFLDAVKDIDDAMSMISLYAFLAPEIKSESTIEFHHALPSGLHTQAKDVVKRWMSYVGRGHKLNKAFISIKGYYYEAVVKGQRVMWMMPHEYASKFPSGVQQYILVTFLEFYIEMMKFVLFKLEADLQRDLEDAQRADEAREAGEEQNGQSETFAPGVLDQTGSRAANKANLTTAMDEDLVKVSNLFQGLVFYCSREVPQKHVRLIVEAGGGNVVSTFGPGVTHYVVDRPQLLAGHTQQNNVEYIQPQYMWDSYNARVLLPAQGYRIGETLPPHVSPFTVSLSNSKADQMVIEDTKKHHPKVLGHIPARAHEIRKIVDPTYSAIDPNNKVAELEDDFSDDEDAVAGAPILDDDGEDDVSLSGDERDQANYRPEWQEEEVTEHVKRTAASAFKVKKQRDLNMMNMPTDEAVAFRRQERAKQMESKKKAETREDRLKRKVAEAERNDKATRKMQLQVARKKAAKYYKMVQSAVSSNQKKEKILASKAKAIAEGKATAEGNEFRSTNPKKAAKPKKSVNPYKSLPKWVR